jgi:MFS transporter, YNFM family, putative membrane transport protein
MEMLLFRRFFQLKCKKEGRIMTYIEKGTEDYKRASGALFIGAFVTFAILYTTQPLMPVFAEEFHVSAPMASLTLSLSTGVMAFAMLIAATISDRIGKKKIMVLSMFATSILGILTAISPDFWTLLVFRTLIGVFIAGIPSIAMAYVAEEFNPNGIGKIMGLYISGTSVGGMSGRIITGALTDAFSWRTAVISIGFISLILSFVFLMTLPSSRHTADNKIDRKTGWVTYKELFHNKKLVLLILLPFLLMGSFVTLFNYIGFFLIEPPFQLSQTVVGFIFIVYLFGTFSSVYMGKKADEHGSPVILRIAIFIAICGAILTLTHSLIGIILGVSIFTFGFFASHSVASSWMGDFAEGNKAQASSLYLLFYYLGSSLIGSFGGYFWMHFHWFGVICFISILILLAFLIVSIVQKENNVPATSQIQIKS